MRPGLELLEEEVGNGEPVERHEYYRIRLKMWFNKGDPVVWDEPWGVLSSAKLLDEGATLVTAVRLDREHLISGLFYGCLGMRIGGTRRLRIAPHLAYGDEGVPDVIPQNALLTAELTVLGPGSAT